MLQQAISLHLITNNNTDKLMNIVSQAIAGGVDYIQLRNKQLDKLFLFEIGKQLLTLTRPKKIPLIINDHIDLAVALDAEGVHLGQTDLPVSFARKLLGKKKIIGLSIQTIAQAENAIHADADYFGVGPVFPSTTKTDAAAMGLIHLKKITEILKKPCIAIGGITIENVPEVLGCHVSGIAVVSGICDAKNPMAATKNYISLLK